MHAFLIFIVLDMINKFCDLLKSLSVSVICFTNERNAVNSFLQQEQLYFCLEAFICIFVTDTVYSHEIDGDIKLLRR